MRLILTQEVVGLGDPGDIVEVKDGYGRNYLVPQGMAIAATRGAERQVAEIRRSREARVTRDLESAQEAERSLSDVVVRVPAKAGSSGRLFGAVTESSISKAITAAGGPTVDRRKVSIESPIRSLGRHRVTLRLHPDVTVALSVDVVAG